MEKLSDDVLQAVLDAHKVIASIDRVTSRVDKYTVSLLEELKIYRGIGTVEECREAVEKKKPKKVIRKPWEPSICPTCGMELSESIGDGYYKHWMNLKRCPYCGQNIDTENLEGKEDECD